MMVVQPPAIDDQMTLFYSGGDKREAGVGFMVTSHAARSVIAFQPISDRLAVLTIKGTIKTHIISVYAPTETCQDPVKDDFYNQLQQTLDSLPQTDVILLAGDFNAHIGTDRTGWENSMGQFGHGHINDNGLRLLSIANGSQTNVQLDGVQIEQVQKFKYLGSLVQEKKVASTVEVHSRIGQATAAFASLKWCLWKQTHISNKTKIRLFKTLILPILFYGSETWTLLKQDLNKLEVFQMRCLR
ncbi:craniofacial development protein 2-like [Erpetoichthys calabaricus]|uniref:craniofacial development protein 2-like n=1 Tax=Erpetoichthys calabaricus TaxID=27687 RepID=UPI0022344786|nr:craniofacial development protein 2-like [Erpetoichthys calabaricus]